MDGVLEQPTLPSPVQFPKIPKTRHPFLPGYTDPDTAWTTWMLTHGDSTHRRHSVCKGILEHHRHETPKRRRHHFLRGTKTHGRAPLEEHVAIDNEMKIHVVPKKVFDVIVGHYHEFQDDRRQHKLQEKACKQRDSKSLRARRVQGRQHRQQNPQCESEANEHRRQGKHAYRPHTHHATSVVPRFLEFLIQECLFAFIDVCLFSFGYASSRIVVANWSRELVSRTGLANWSRELGFCGPCLGRAQR